MIHPSCQELIATINEGQDMDEAPVVSSRYSLVLATSKRARQLIAGAEPLVKVKKGMKPLSVAVERLRFFRMMCSRRKRLPNKKPFTGELHENTIYFPGMRQKPGRF